QTQSTELLGNQDAEVAELGHLLPQLHRDFTLDRIQLVGYRQHFVDREIARGLLDHLALLSHVTHTPVPLFGMRLDRRKSIISGSSVELRAPSPYRNPSVCQVTIPCPGRLVDSLLSTTVLRATSVCPG